MPARLFLVFLCSFLAFQTPAQQSCPPIPVNPPDPSALLFSPQQENYLGEIISEHMQSSFLVIDEDDINDHLRKVADRVVRQLPETNSPVSVLPLRSAPSPSLRHSRRPRLRIAEDGRVSPQ